MSGPDRWRSHTPLLVALATFGAATLLVWWQVLSTSPTTMTTCGCGDPAFTLWYLGFPAHALIHGGSLGWTDLLWHPSGVDVLDAASSLGLGVPLAWLTVLAGPVATMNLSLVLAPGLSALAMWLLLRRWVCSTVPATVGGLLFGFSPLVLMNLAEGHLVVGFLAPVPLLVLCLDEILVGSRGRELRAGVAAGCLVVLEFLISPEVLVMTLMALTLAAVLGLVARVHRGRPGLQPRQRRGLLLAAAIAGLGLAIPGFAALGGRSHVTGSVYPSGPLWQDGTTLRHLLLPTPAAGALHAFALRFGGFQGPQLSADYLGLGVVVGVGASLVLLRRRARAWLLVAIGATFLVLALGTPGSGWRPWALLGPLPILNDIVPVRLLVITWLCVAALIGLGLEEARRRLGTRGLSLGLGVLALAPTAAYLLPALPFTAVPVAAPAAFSRQAGQVVLPIPAAFSALQSAMAWQALAGYDWSMAGGDGPGSDPSLRGRDRAAVEAIATVSGSFPSSRLRPRSAVEVRASLERWGVTRIVMAAGATLPAYDRPMDPVGASVLITSATGTAPRRGEQAWVWTFRAGAAPPPRVLDIGRCGGATMGVSSAATCALVHEPIAERSER